MFITRYTSISNEALPGNQESQKSFEKTSFLHRFVSNQKLITKFAG